MVDSQVLCCELRGGIFNAKCFSLFRLLFCKNEFFYDQNIDVLNVFDFSHAAFEFRRNPINWSTFTTSNWNVESTEQLF